MTSPVAGNLPAVVVMNMHYSGLAIARNLAGHCDQIHGLSFNPDFFGNYSKYCTYHSFPDSATEAEACKAFLLEFAGQFAEKPLLLATRDHDLNLILKYRTELADRYIVPFSTNDVIETIMDKTRLFEIAREVGIYCPKDLPVNSLEQLHAHREELEFPVIVKPVAASQWRREPIWDLVEKRKAIMFRDFESLNTLYEKLCEHDPVVTVQEYIPGPDTNLHIFGSYHNPDSGLARYFTCRKLLQYPAHSGTGVALEALPIPEIAEFSLRLLDRLNYRGISEIEYKYDETRDRHALIEINTRHWDQHALGAAVGVNLSQALYQDVNGIPVSAEQQIDKPVKWVADDDILTSFINNLGGKHYPPATYWRAITGKKTFAVLNLADPKPALHLYSNMLSHYWRYGWSFIARKLRLRKD